MIPPEKRAAGVYVRGDLLTVVAIDRNAAGHGIDRPDPDVFSREVATAEEIGRSVIAALISNHANAPLQPWQDPDSPTVWKALGFKSEATWLRGLKSADVRQVDYQSARISATSRRGASFTFLKSPVIEVDLNDPVAVGEGVLSALAASRG